MFESANVLPSSLRCGTVTDGHHTRNDLSHPCFSFLSRLPRHNPPPKLSELSLAGETGTRRLSLHLHLRKHLLRTAPGRLHDREQSVRGVQRWLCDRLCPVPAASPLHVCCVKPCDCHSSHLSQMPSDPHEKRSREEAAEKSATEALQQTPLLPRRISRIRHLCSLSQEGYLGMKTKMFFSSIREKFAAIKVQH